MQNLTFKCLSAALFVTLALGGCATSGAGDDELDESTSEAVSAGFVCKRELNGLDTSSGSRSVVKAVRAAGHPGFDRFVIEFTGDDVPGWFVRRQDSATFSWYGESDVPLSGAAGLFITVSASMYNGGWSSPESGTPFSGALRFEPNSTKLVAEAAHLGEFEGMHDWALGLKKKSCFRVSKLANPPRLVVDLKAQ